MWEEESPSKQSRERPAEEDGKSRPEYRPKNPKWELNTVIMNIAGRSEYRENAIIVLALAVAIVNV